MKTQHTRSEWSYTAYGKTSNGEIIICGGNNTFGNLIAEVYKQRNTDEQIANARLIAAAPELLDALMDMEHLVESRGCDSHEREVLSRASAAIKKATQP